jgi:hypothetical protein
MTLSMVKMSEEEVGEDHMLYIYNELNISPSAKTEEEAIILYLDTESFDEVIFMKALSGMCWQCRIIDWDNFFNKIMEKEQSRSKIIPFLFNKVDHDDIHSLSLIKAYIEVGGTIDHEFYMKISDSHHVMSYILDKYGPYCNDEFIKAVIVRILIFIDYHDGPSDEKYHLERKESLRIILSHYEGKLSDDILTFLTDEYPRSQEICEYARRNNWKINTTSLHPYIANTLKHYHKAYPFNESVLVNAINKIKEILMLWPELSVCVKDLITNKEYYKTLFGDDHDKALHFLLRLNLH